MKKLRKDLENVIPDTNREVMAEICAPKPNPASQAETYYSTNLGPRVVRNLIFKMGSERIEISYGWMVLERLRMGRYWTAPRLASAGLIDQKYRTQCPCCLENTKEDELHYLLECKTWNKERTFFLGDIEAYNELFPAGLSIKAKLMVLLSIAVDPLKTAVFARFTAMELELAIVDMLDESHYEWRAHVVTMVARYLSRTNLRRFSLMEFQALSGQVAAP